MPQAMDGLATIPPADPGPALDQNTMPAILMVVGIMLLVMIFMNKLRKRSSRPPSSGEAMMNQLARLRSGAGRDTLEEVKADAEELAQRLAAQLDNKAAHLEKLIRDADERLARLDAAGNPAPELRVTRPDPLTPSEPHNPAHERIYELADQGMSPVDIARTLDKPTGQVELVLSLRNAS